MKTLLLVLALSSASASVQANDKLKTCENISELAGIVMENRQGDISMAEQYRVAGDNEVAQLIVKQAYSRAKMSSERYKKQSVIEFKNVWFKSCLEHL